jgi:hypothetical protein
MSKVIRARRSARPIGVVVVLLALVAAAFAGSRPANADRPRSTADVRPGEVAASPPAAVAAPPLAREGPDALAVAAASSGVIRVYKDSNAWFGENRDSATLASLGKTLGVDWFVHPIADCQSGIPAGTAVVLFTSNGQGLPSATAAQNAPACQAALAAFLDGGGVLIVDMGDNDGGGGFMAPGATGTPTLTFPDPCQDATLTPAASGHPIVIGLDGVPGTGDDLSNDIIDMQGSCSVAHGNLEDGISLPPEAEALMTARYGGLDRPVLAEYCHGSGRVVLDTLTKEFVAQQPVGMGPTAFLRNLLAYALSQEAACVIDVAIDVKPGSTDNPINLRARGVVPVAILTMPGFDALGVDAPSVCFGDAEEPGQRDCTEAHGRSHREDVDGDGDADLVFHFDVRETGIDLGDTEACLHGETFGGIPIAGCDAVRPH